MKRFFIIFALASSLSACVSFLPEPEAPDGLYRLGDVTAEETLSVDQTVLVRRPEAPRHLAGTDIIAEDGQAVLTVVKSAQWADRMPRLLQMAFLDYVNSDGSGSALSPETRSRAAFELVWRISDFHLEGDRAVVRGELTLLNGTSRQPVKQITLESTRSASGNNTSARVAALSDAGKDFVRQATSFVAETVALNGQF